MAKSYVQLYRIFDEWPNFLIFAEVLRFDFKKSEYMYKQR